MSETFDEESRKALTDYRMEQADSAISDAELLLQNDRLNAAANRIYYACFYAAEALLIRNGIRAATHTGVRQMFGLHFVQKGLIENQWGRFLGKMERMREGADYDFFIQYEKQELLDILPQAKQFIAVIKAIF